MTSENGWEMNITYDNLIRKAADSYLPGVDWRLIKAQLWQESRLNPNAVSPAGAQGIAQFMPATWQDVSHQLHFPPSATPFDTNFAILACCAYMRQLFNKWTAPRPDADRYALTLASYNAGFGNLLKAQKLAGGANQYHAIIAKLEQVTGNDNANETKNYVQRIFDIYMNQLLWGI